MTQRHDLLKALLNDPHSTSEERAAAQRELYGSSQQAQALQDHELESYLLVRGVPQRSSESLSLRQSLSPELRRLLDDMCSPVFGNALAGSSVSLARPASLERLTALLDRTTSDIVKLEVASAIGAIRKLIDAERTNEQRSVSE
jgi:hypothetical protein